MVADTEAATGTGHSSCMEAHIREKDSTGFAAHLRGNREQCFLRPLGVHVNGAAVDESWELAASVAELVTHRGHRQHDVQLLSDSVNECGIAPFFG